MRSLFKVGICFINLILSFFLVEETLLLAATITSNSEPNWQLLSFYSFLAVTIHLGVIGSAVDTPIPTPTVFHSFFCGLEGSLQCKCKWFSILHEFHKIYRFGARVPFGIASTLLPQTCTLSSLSVLIVEMSNIWLKSWSNQKMQCLDFSVIPCIQYSNYNCIGLNLKLI